MIRKKSAAVLLGEEAVEAPHALLHRANVEQVDDEEVTGLGALDADRAGEEVHDRQIDVAHVVGGIVVLDETAGPVISLDDEVVAGIDPGHDRNVGVPAVMHHVIFIGRLGEIDLDQCLWHREAPLLHGWLDGQIFRDLCGIDGAARIITDDLAVLDHQHTVGDIEREAQDLLGHDD
ncbi:hypothetical protein ACVWZV_001333 [Bradyrhizobium sp. GM5.1]